MAKDPAFLFYSSDFLSGTFTLSNEHKGMYITLLCLQHQKGRLKKVFTFPNFAIFGTFRQIIIKSSITLAWV